MSPQRYSWTILLPHNMRPSPSSPSFLIIILPRPQARSTFTNHKSDGATALIPCASAEVQGPRDAITCHVARSGLFYLLVPRAPCAHTRPGKHGLQCRVPPSTPFYPDEPDRLAVSSSLSDTTEFGHPPLAEPTAPWSKLTSLHGSDALATVHGCPVHTCGVSRVHQPAPLKRGLLQSISWFHAWHVPRPRRTFITWVNPSWELKHHDIPGFVG